MIACSPSKHANRYIISAKLSNNLTMGYIMYTMHICRFTISAEIIGIIKMNTPHKYHTFLKANC